MELGHLRKLATAFLRTKRFEAAEGIVLAEHMKAVIAVQACLPILNLGLEWHRNWKTVVVVPKHFEAKARILDHAGVVHEWEELRIASPGAGVLWCFPGLRSKPLDGPLGSLWSFTKRPSVWTSSMGP